MKKHQKNPTAAPDCPRAVPPPAPEPLRPRYKLFWTLCIILAIWVAALLALYFTTVHPA